jgi:hypothetical protein
VRLSIHRAVCYILYNVFSAVSHNTHYNTPISYAAEAALMEVLKKQFGDHMAFEATACKATKLYSVTNPQMILMGITQIYGVFGQAASFRCKSYSLTPAQVYLYSISP